MWTDSIDMGLVITTSDEIGHKRFLQASRQLNKLGIPFTRYAAVHNKENGALGLLNTMKNIFDAHKKGNILCFEDDLLMIRDDVNESMEEVMKELPEDFDCLYIGCNLLVSPQKFSKHLYKIRSAYSSHAILYSTKGIDLILSQWNEDKAYDSFLMSQIQPYGNCYCVNPLLCVQSNGVSNIFKYDPGKQIGIERWYNPGTNEIDWGLMMRQRFIEFTKDL